MLPQPNSHPRIRDILLPLILVNLLFFMWGFIWNLTNVLVALFKETFELSNFRTSLLTSVSFLAFFALSYPAKFIIERLKTKRSIVLGAEAILYQLMTPYFMEQAPLTKARAVDISGILFLGLMTGRLMGAGILVRVNAGRLVGGFVGAAGALILVSMIGGGYVAVYSIVLTGFFIPMVFGLVADFFDLKTSLIVVIVPLLLAFWYGFSRARQIRQPSPK